MQIFHSIEKVLKVPRAIKVFILENSFYHMRCNNSAKEQTTIGYYFIPVYLSLSPLCPFCLEIRIFARGFVHPSECISAMANHLELNISPSRSGLQTTNPTCMQVTDKTLSSSVGAVTSRRGKHQRIIHVMEIAGIQLMVLQLYPLNSTIHRIEILYQQPPIMGTSNEILTLICIRLC